jgi:hypothetical protein
MSLDICKEPSLKVNIDTNNVQKQISSLNHWTWWWGPSDHQHEMSPWKVHKDGIERIESEMKEQKQK